MSSRTAILRLQVRVLKPRKILGRNLGTSLEENLVVRRPAETSASSIKTFPPLVPVRAGPVSNLLGSTLWSVDGMVRFRSEQAQLK